MAWLADFFRPKKAQPARRSGRRLSYESLEPRQMLAADVPFETAVAVDPDIQGATVVHVGDIDRDGKNDIVIAEGGKHAGGRRTFAWYEADNWTKHDITNNLPGPFLGDMRLADINQDGWLDIVIPEDNHSSGSGNLYWYENPQGNSTGNWTRHTIWSGLANTYHQGELEVADMDQDGRLDVVVRHLGDRMIRIAFQNANGTWTLRSFGVQLREGLKVADLDRDGNLDILMNGFWWAGPDNWRTDNYTQYTIDDTFFTQPASGLNNSVKINVGDIDADGIPDVVISPAEGQIEELAWYKMPDNPRMQPIQKFVIEPNFGKAHQAEIGDIDLDGDLDIMTGRAFGQNGVFIWRNNGDGTQWTRQTIDSNLGLYYGVLADIGNDGDLDIVGPNTYSNSSKVYLYENTVANQPANNPPSAVNDSVTVTEDHAGLLINVLGNDSDPDGDPLSITAVSNPPHGAAAIQNGQIRYTPDANYVGNDSFTYTISDGNGGFNTATVSVNITAVNDAPSLQDGLSFAVLESAANNTLVGTVGVNDPDAAESFAFALTGGNTNNAFSIDNSGQIRVNNSAALAGNPSFNLSVRVTDSGGLTDTTTVAVQVNQVSPWSSQDIGNVNHAGSHTLSGGVHTVQGGGADIWYSADEFHYVYQTLTGDGEIIAQVTSLEQTSVWAKAGVMFRDSLNANSQQAHMLVHADRGTSLDYRVQTGGGTTKQWPNDGVHAPVWVRLVRDGNKFTGYKSTNGTAWTEVGNITISMGATVYVGLAVTAHDDSKLADATFADVQINGAAPPPVNQAPTISNQSFSVLENASTGATVGTVAASDPDAGDTLSFAITAGNTGGAFAIDNSGQLTVDNTGSLTGGSTFDLTVRVTDSGGLTDTATITVSVTPVVTTGLLAEFFDFTSSLSTLPDLTGLTADVTRTDAQLNYANIPGAWAGLDSRFDNTFASRHTGTLRIDAAGAYTFYLNSDDGSRLWVDGELIIDNNGTHSMRELSATRTLAAGDHAIRVEYFENGGSAGLILSWAGPGFSKQVIPAGQFDSNGQPPPAANWTSQDIGGVNHAGSHTLDAGVHTIQGGGKDIWYSADEFHYAWQTLSGDGEIIAQVLSLTNTNQWSKAGVMIRESLNANSKQAHMLVHAQRGTSLDHRISTGGGTSKIWTDDNISAPTWVRLVRSGDTFTGYHSSDGVNWVLNGSVTISMGVDVYVGLAVTAHDDSQIATAEFGNVQIID